jgi:branched-chain amino acid transport system substrate-binding protein
MFKDMKKTIFFLIVFILMIQCSQNNREEITIGIVLPLTGSAAVWGQNAKMGIDLALSEILKIDTLNKVKIRIVYQDSKSETKDAVSAFQNLLSLYRIPVVIGDIASSSVLAMAPIAERNKVVLLSPGASNPDISKAGDFIFRNWQSDALEGEIDARFAFEKLEVRNVCILNVNNAYGVGLKDYFIKTFEGLGGNILQIESFEQDATDMRTQLSKINSRKPDLIFMPSYPNEMISVLKQAKELNINLHFVSTQAFDDPTILENAKDAANGVIFSVPAPPDTSKTIVQNFIKHYSMKYNVEPGVCSNTGYDAMYLIAEAANKGARMGEDFKNFLYSVENYYGAAGNTTFDKNGDVIKPFIFKIVKNNHFINY